MTDSTIPTPTSIPTFFCATIGGTISTTPHVWTADSNGLFHTTTDLKAEWTGYYDQMIAGDASTLTFIQRLEGNAEAVFENTNLNTLSAATQVRDREDVQREFDAISAAMTDLGMSGNGPLTTQDYLRIEQTIDGDNTLLELGMQGHGLNNPSVPRYNGYTNDFQNGVDGKTLYIGGGLDNNENALTDFFDDVVLSHLVFPTVAQNGQLEQLNQNANAEDTLTNSTGAIDDAGWYRVYKAADFSTTPGTAGSTPDAPPPVPATPAQAGTITTLFGATISGTITINGHTWTADANGRFVTTANLATEWKADYQMMENGQGASLTGIQRLEGNAEAVFENTGLANLSASQLTIDRMDAQREFDAIAGAMQQAGIDPSAQITDASYLTIERTLQNNAALEELAIQGHGLNSPPSSRYNGYTNDFQNNVDNKTLYVGPGLDAGERAIAGYFDDFIMTHLPFPTVAQNGEITQLNQNGAHESTLQEAVAGMNQSMFSLVLNASDFNIPGQPQTTVPATAATPGTITTVFGATIANSMTVNGHLWVAGTDGLFHTTTNLAAEWQGYYQTMLAGNGASLTAIQRLEGNAEAVFENTGLAQLKAATQARDREDVQREFDAIAVEMGKLGLGSALLSAQDYINIEQGIRSDAALQELAIQGHGLNSPPSARYNGYTNDFQNNVDRITDYVGGGLDNGENALTDFFDDVVISHLTYPVVPENGNLEQLNQNGNNEDTLAPTVNAFNDALFRRVYVASDFSANPNATGATVYVTPAMANAATPAGPTAGAGQVLTYYGFAIANTMTVDGHTWTTDANGRFQTTTDLNLEWYNAWQAAQSGQTLTFVQRWEANAEAMFLNTSLNQVSDGMAATDRADVQRVIDAVATVMGQLGLGSGPLSQQDYLNIEHALQDNAALEELALQGIGLNVPYVAGQTKYNGYTNDFQYSIDSHTLYVGGGTDTGERALSDVFGDAIVTHLMIPTVMQNGERVQLNQNANASETLAQAVAQVNDMLFTKVLKSSDFMIPGAMPVAAAPPPPATITTLYGDTIAGTMLANGHTWVADANGLFHTTTNLDIEWQNYYQIMLSGHGDTLTPTQRMEANAEAVFENTAINNLWMGAAKEAAYREDVQRVIDAIAQAMQTDKTLYGIDPAAPLTEASYLQLDTTIRGNPALLELALQGAGLQSAPSSRYYGAYHDIYAGADWSTYFVGGGTDNGKLAAPYFFFDQVISFLPSANVWQGGHWEQLDSNGNAVMSAQQAAANLNQTMFRQVYVKADFSTTATATGPAVLLSNAPAAGAAAIASITAPVGDIVTLSGALISNTMTANGHTWTAGSDGLFHTSNLTAEWQGYYQQMLNGQGGSLTAIQRMEGNAEAVAEATGLTSLSAATQQAYREDVQRQIDAMAGAIQIDASTLGINPQIALLQGSYLALERTLQSNAALEELAVQGHGVTAPPSARYRGYINDIANASTIKYVGGGNDNGKSALGAFLGDNIMTETPFAVIWRNGQLVQLDQSGNVDMTLATAISAADDTMWYRTYKSTDFHK